MAVAQAIKKWIETYNADREKMVSFVSRYDKTISDSRLAEPIIGICTENLSPIIATQNYVLRLARKDKSR